MMNKILSLRAIPCGWESIDFSQLYINSDEKEEQLPINVLLFQHRKMGTMLINTGCSELLKKNMTDYLRFKQNRKIRFDKDGDIVSRLNESDMDGRIIKKVLLTHCSPECCGALPLLPHYELLASAQVLWRIKTRNLEDGMMRSTLPDHTIPIRASGIFNGKSVLQPYFKWVFDVLGDGSVLGVDLRGRCREMMGYYFPEQQFFFAADAAVDERVLDKELVPNEKMLSQQSDPDDYLVTLSTLRRFHRENPSVTIRFLHSSHIPGWQETTAKK